MADSITTLTAAMVEAYLSHNKVGAAELPELIAMTHKALAGLGQEPVALEPPVQKPNGAEIRKSRQQDYLVSFEDGKRYKSMKRHLSIAGLTPDEYRTKWGLPNDYPMVAPAYSAQRSALAKSLGLGQKVGRPAAPAPAKPAPKGRKPKAINPADETFT